MQSKHDMSLSPASPKFSSSGFQTQEGMFVPHTSADLLSSCQRTVLGPGTSAVPGNTAFRYTLAALDMESMSFLLCSPINKWETVKPGHLMHKQNKLVPWTIFSGGLCAGNAWNPSRFWECPPARPSFHSWTPKEIQCPFSLDLISEKASKSICPQLMSFPQGPFIPWQVKSSCKHATAPAERRGLWAQAQPCCNGNPSLSQPRMWAQLTQLPAKVLLRGVSNCYVKITAPQFGAVTAMPEPWTGQSIKWGTHFQCHSIKTGLK